MRPRLRCHIACASGADARRHRRGAAQIKSDSTHGRAAATRRWHDWIARKRGGSVAIVEIINVAIEVASVKVGAKVVVEVGVKVGAKVAIEVSAKVVRSVSSVGPVKRTLRHIRVDEGINFLPVTLT